MGTKDVLNPSTTWTTGRGCSQADPAGLRLWREPGHGQRIPRRRAGRRNGRRDTVTVNAWSDSEITVHCLGCRVPDAQRHTFTAAGTSLVTACRSKGNATRRLCARPGAPPPAARSARPVRTPPSRRPSTRHPPAGSVTVQPGLYEESVILNSVCACRALARLDLINASRCRPRNSSSGAKRSAASVCRWPERRRLLVARARRCPPTERRRVFTGDTVDNAPLLFGNEEGAGSL